MSLADTYVIFEIGGAAYGVSSTSVLHIEMLEHVTPVPNTAEAVDGVVFSRGQVIPAVNLRARFGLPRESPTPRTRLIFIQAHQRIVALVVDAAREFQRIPADAIRAVQDTLVGIRGNYVTGVATVKNRSVLLLDVAAVLTIEEATPPTSPIPVSSSAS